MREWQVSVADPAGLHARLAAVVVRLARELAAEIVLGYADRWANGRSLASLLALAVPSGATLTLRAKGPDEALAVVALSQILQQTPALTPITPAAVGWGEAFLLPAMESSEPENLHVSDPAEEWAKLTTAIQRAREELASLSAWAEKMGTPVAEMVRTQQEILGDAPLLARWRQGIAERRLSALESLRLLAEEFGSGRAQESLAAVGQRLQRWLVGRADALSQVCRPIVLVGRHITETDLLGPQRRWLRGVVTTEERCGAHVVALCEAWGIPLVTGFPPDALANLSPGDVLWVDGSQNRAEVKPSPERLAKLQAEAEHLRSSVIHSAEGTSVGPALWATLDDPALAAEAVQAGVTGIGLVRTEWLCWERTVPPSEEEQVQIYEAMLAALGGRPVTFRLADLRGGKVPPHLAGLWSPDVWLGQLRALARLSSHHPLRVTFPCVASLAEWEAARSLWLRAREEQGLPTGNENMRASLVVMVEHPALAGCLEAILPQVCGLALGTNDLMLHLSEGGANAPGRLARFLYLVHEVVELARGQDVPVVACGQAVAEWPEALWLWGLGVNGLSVAPARLPGLRAALARYTEEQARRLAHELLQTLEGGAG